MMKLAVESSLNKSAPYGSQVLEEQGLGGGVNAALCNDVATSLVIGNCQNDNSESSMHHEKFHELASRLGRTSAEYGALFLGAIALELVILFSINLSDGLFLILPALAVGTCVYIRDGKRNTKCDPIPKDRQI